jgi:hypothetical protein
MYCPQCGQQQVSEATRFCSRCGFLLDGVVTVLATGGAVPTRNVKPGYKQLSPQSKGIRQGALLMLSTVLLVPLVAIIGVAVLDLPAVIVGITAIMCFLGGLLRIFYALLMEEPIAPVDLESLAGHAHYVSPQFGRPAQNSALPQASTNAAPAWRPRPITAEIYQPPSVTENTTRLLDKDEPKNR